MWRAVNQTWIHVPITEVAPTSASTNFLKSTWKSTPYGNKDIYDPEFQALATAWMWKKGRKNEWACNKSLLLFGRPRRDLLRAPHLMSVSEAATSSTGLSWCALDLKARSTCERRDRRVRRHRA